MDSLQHIRERSRTPADDRVTKRARLGSPGQTEAAEDPAPDDVVLDAPVEHTRAGNGFGLKMQGKKKGARKDKKKFKHKLPEPYSNEDVIHRDVVQLLGQDVVDRIVEEGKDWDPPYNIKDEVELTVSVLSSNGESLSVAPSADRPWVIITPFALPGEVIRARVYRHSQLHSFADLIEVIKPNLDMRDDSRVQCKYFGTCGGCQYQMLSYDTQLQLKHDVIVKAYKNFSGLPTSSVPTILPTTGSPLQYGYRTKLTPHFDSPAKALAGKGGTDDGSRPDWFNIGFNKAGTRVVMDIEECPIATPAINEALGPVRADIFKNLHKYKKGVSLVLRESLEIPPADQASTEAPPSSDKKICITDHKGTVRERVGDNLFEYGASGFFQNNNSVLVPLTSYVRDAIFSPSSSPGPKPTHLVDAYCGSGLFAITLSPHFDVVAGIELSAESIRSAERNASLNNLPAGKCSFLAGDAADIFGTVQTFPRERTVLIIDPPRKGSDERFVEQMISFGCGTVVYVSCNVHTQARDLGMILRKSEKMEGKRYILESVRGFDLFPQTAHVESVAVLRLVEA